MESLVGGVSPDVSGMKCVPHTGEAADRLEMLDIRLSLTDNMSVSFSDSADVVFLDKLDARLLLDGFVETLSFSKSLTFGSECVLLDFLELLRFTLDGSVVSSPVSESLTVSSNGDVLDG